MTAIFANGIQLEYESFGNDADPASGKPVDAPYSQADMAADVAVMISALELGKSHVVGMSMGAVITQRLMLDHPGKVRSTVVMMSTTGHPELPPMDPATQAILFLASDGPNDPESVVALGLKIFEPCVAAVLSVIWMPSRGPV